MSGDEGFALLASLLLAVVGVWLWYGPLIRVTRIGGSAAGRLALGAVPAVCLLGLFRVLTDWAAREVREGPEYIGLFLLAGMGWVAAGVGMSAAVGVSFRDDAIERRNPAAGLVAAVAVVGCLTCFAGSNIGEGETIWTTFFPAVVGTVLLWLLWLAVELATRVSEAITIDRDTASGMRLAGFLAGAGLVLGYAGAGDWRSIDATLADFARLGWPAALLAAGAVAAQWVLRPTPGAPRPPVVRHGVVPALVLLLAGIGGICIARRMG